MASVEPVERLLNLIIALQHARVRMTRDQIRNTVAGYEPEDTSLSPEAATKAKDAFERMFERDKKALRQMGVPLVTVVDNGHGDDIGYKINATDAAMPAIDLTPAEIAVVGVAGEYWQGVALGEDAQLGLTKLVSGAEHRIPVALPIAARSTGSQDNTATLIEAIYDRQAVTFEYSSATSGTAVRTVQPWRIILRGAAEYLVGYDVDKQAQRTFRVARMHGSIKVVGDDHAYEIPEGVDAGLYGADEPAKTATVGVRLERGHSLRAKGTYVRTEGDWDILTVPYAYEDVLRDEILTLGGAARAVEPASLADAVALYAAKALEVARG